MSLINQMLRDLEQRNSHAPADTRLLNVKTAPHRQNRKLAWLGLLPLIALPSGYLWHRFQTHPSLDQATPATSEPLMAEAKQAAVTPAAVETKPASIAKTIEAEIFTQPTPKPPSAPIIAKAIQKQVEPPQEKKSRAPAAATAKIANTPREQAEDLYRQAQHNASLLMARENLQEALTIDPSYLPARTLLLQTLIKSQAGAELGQLVDDSLRLFPNHPLFLKTRAHLFVQQKNFAEAVNVLERIDADTIDDSAYLALLAAGYQQLQRFPQAVRVYRKLTQLQPDKAENWLGLAIAQDKLNQSQAAAQSYRQALDKKTLSAEVVSYINQRLGDLTR